MLSVSILRFYLLNKIEYVFKIDFDNKLNSIKNVDRVAVVNHLNYLNQSL